MYISKLALIFINIFMTRSQQIKDRQEKNNIQI